MRALLLLCLLCACVAVECDCAGQATWLVFGAVGWRRWLAVLVGGVGWSGVDTHKAITAATLQGVILNHVWWTQYDSASQKGARQEA